MNIYIYNWIWSKRGKLSMTLMEHVLLKLYLKSHLDCEVMHLKCRKYYICHWKMNISVLFCIYFGHWIWMGSCRKTRCCHSFSHWYMNWMLTLEQQRKRQNRAEHSCTAQLLNRELCFGIASTVHRERGDTSNHTRSRIKYEWVVNL